MRVDTNNTAVSSTLIESPAPTVSNDGKGQTYSQILKSSALIGGSSIAGIAIGIFRTKAIAVFLGPSGVGLMGLYSQIADLTQSICGMGINSSGVRQIAEAVGSGETARIARTVAVLRRAAMVLGAIGGLFLVVFGKQVSILTFGTGEYATSVALLSLAVFFRSISAGQVALIQGMRRISDLARVGVLSSLFGALISVPLVYFLREKGVVPSLICAAAMTVLISWRYSQKVQIQSASMSVSEANKEATVLLKLGLAFMASGILTTGAAYATRIIILHKVGFDGAGVYQSAWTLGGLYVGIILQAMGSDFYPRLTAAANDNKECNRLVNEQAEVGLLMAGPGLIATLTFAPVIITLFYTREFAPAVEPLRWLCLGLMLRVVAWPMGFIILAQNLQRIFFWTELAATSIQVGLAWIAVHYFGLAGAGMAFFGQYIWHSIVIYAIVRRRTGFRWSSANKRIAPLILSLTGLVFIGFYLLPFWLAIALGTMASVGGGVYSMRALATLIPPDRMPRLIRRVLALFRLVPSEPE